MEDSKIINEKDARPAITINFEDEIRISPGRHENAKLTKIDGLCSTVAPVHGGEWGETYSRLHYQQILSAENPQILS